MFKGKFLQLYNKIIFEMAEQNMPIELDSKIIRNDYPIFSTIRFNAYKNNTNQNKKPDIVQIWMDNIFDYPFYFKAQTKVETHQILIENILYDILANTNTWNNFHTALTDLNGTNNITQLITNHYRNYASVKLQMDLVINGSCREKYQNREYKWVRYVFRNQNLINDIKAAIQQHVDVPIVKKLIGKLVSQSQSITANIPVPTLYEKCRNYVWNNPADFVDILSEDLVDTIKKYNELYIFNRKTKFYNSAYRQDLEQLLNSCKSYQPNLPEKILVKSSNNNVKKSCGIFPYLHKTELLLPFVEYNRSSKLSQTYKDINIYYTTNSGQTKEIPYKELLYGNYINDYKTLENYFLQQ